MPKLTLIDWVVCGEADKLATAVGAVVSAGGVVLILVLLLVLVLVLLTAGVAEVVKV